MAQEVLGIEFGEETLRGVLVDGSTKNYRVLGFAQQRIPAQREGQVPEDSIVEALKSLLSQLRGGKESVAVTVPSSRCSFRPLTLPFVGEEQVRKVVKFELEGHLHQWNIEDVVVDFYRIAEAKGQSHLLVAAAPKDYLRRLFKTCENAGFDPIVADLDAAALFNSAIASGIVDSDESYVLVHVGEQNVLILVIENRILKLARSVRIRSSPVSQNTPEGENSQKDTFSSSGAMEEDDSEESGAEEEVFVALEEDQEGASFGEFSYGRGVAALVVREVARSLVSLRLDMPIAGIFASGSWELVEGLNEAMERKFHQPLQDFDLFERVEHSLDAQEAQKASPYAPIAFGAALKLIDIDAVGIDFRKEDLRYTRRFDQIKKELAFFVCCLCILLGMENAFLFKKNEKGKAEYKNYFEVAMTNAEGLAGEEFKLSSKLRPLKRIHSLNLKVGEKFKILKERVGRADLKQPQSAFESWRLLFSAIKEIEPKLGSFLIEKYESRSREPSSRRKTVHVSNRVDFVFLGNQVETANARNDLIMHLQGKGWEVGSKGFANLKQGGGISTTLEIRLTVPEVEG